jgi:hypothetical protein
MKLNQLFKRAKKVVDDRGGTDALKQDAQELADVAKGRGSASDKAKAAAEALKDPGAPGPERRDSGAQLGREQQGERAGREGRNE